ncbi:serine threonine protein kinase, CMGC group [Microdochium trichocladiopsis]|uniref:Serine threonine protein kinase, CMGC group n=1 Tax=Microdochium trichocladiopsis TaxID=1682393 RepID=A0A9P8XYY4_9PEZI|nr:serine threonine protein kinase, CMGC group [Microdochium trichocladiopsis]KAH7025100.1 serine threonine protein kinase, CMGC group [Microdochium trichocladiopsis]
MASSWLGWLLHRAGRPWKPLDFSQATRFVRLPAEHKVEEECLPDYLASRYYPVRLGDVLRDQYQIVGKLGFGASSTVWLARDLVRRRHVALKLFVHARSMGAQNDNELDMYRRMAQVKSNHPGRTAVRQLLDSFDISSPDGEHRCLVHPPLWDSMLTFLHRNPEARLPAPLVAYIMQRLFFALDFLHTECHIIHTDIKADNIMFGIADDSVFETFEQEELLNPSPRKEVDGRIIYTCRQLSMPKRHSDIVLCDFGSAVVGDQEHTEDVQPNVYRAPEVILGAPWSYPIDIWNAGCMVWDLFQGRHLFTGYDPEHRLYRSRAHLSEIIALLGPPPSSLLQRGSLTSKFFAENGDFGGGISSPDPVTLGSLEERLQGQEKEAFLRMMDSMLQWDPAKRRTASELISEDWVKI